MAEPGDSQDYSYSSPNKDSYEVLARWRLLAEYCGRARRLSERRWVDLSGDLLHRWAAVNCSILGRWGQLRLASYDSP